MFSISHKLQQLNTFERVLVEALIDALQVPVIGRPLAYALMGVGYVYGRAKRVMS